MIMETMILNEERNVTLTSYILEVGGEFSPITKRPAILIFPGGGYEFCSDREADPVAMSYLKAGYHVFILRYSVGKNATWPNPLNDYEQAMELIRSNAGKWNIYEDKIAVIGFSAGGHLAGAAATMSRNRPNAAILGYAVVSEEVKLCSETAPNIIPYVDHTTCPCFIFATRTDGLVSVKNSVKMIEALTNADISYESHIYAYGPHGFSTCDHSVFDRRIPICSRVPNWVPDSISWIEDMFGVFNEVGMSTPVCKKYVTADREEKLSVDCTMKKLMSHPEAKALLEGMLQQLQVLEADSTLEDSNINRIIHNPEYLTLISDKSLRIILECAHIPQEVIKQVEEQLGTINNR